jgi:hypothetical protein
MELVGAYPIWWEDKCTVEMLSSIAPAYVM